MRRWTVFGRGCGWRVSTRPCEIEQIGSKTIRMILTQGLNRQIRRMCKTQGYEVTSLKRTRVINIVLDKLKPGEYRELSREEIQELYEHCGMMQNGAPRIK